MNNKIKRYLREAEDFSLLCIVGTAMKDIYLKLRESYENLKSLNIT